MIHCSLHLDHWVPSAHENFSKFVCDNFTQLKNKIEKILNTIRTIDTQDIAEIEIDLQLNGMQLDLNSIEFKNFIEFMSNHFNPVLKFNLLDKNVNLQKILDGAYWEAVKKWHENQLEHRTPIQSPLISDTPFIESIVLESKVSSNLVHAVDRLPPPPDANQHVQERSIYLPTLQIERRKTQNEYLVDPLYSGFSDIIRVFYDANILETMEACIGEQGLLHILNQLSVEPIQSHLEKFIQVFLSSYKAIEKFLPYLIRPQGQKLIQMLAELPDELYLHWLKWIELQTTIPNLKKSIQKIHQFYQLLQKYNVKIPVELAEDKGNFSDRVDILTQLLEPTHSIWNSRKHYYVVQAPKLLALPISVLQRLEDILNQSGCKWIRPEMLMPTFEIGEMDPETPAPAHLAGFYTYASQFMQDKQDSAFFQIEELVKEPPSNAEQWQLAAWCATLPNQPSQAVFERLKTNLNESIIADLYAIPPEKRMSVQDLAVMLDMNMNHQVLLKTYAYLFKLQDAAKDIWPLVFTNQGLASWKGDFLTTLVQEFSPDAINVFSFKIFLLAIAENEQQINELSAQFEHLDNAHQIQLIAILSSWDKSSGTLTCEYLNAVLLSTTYSEDTFVEKCPGVKFNCFKSSLDYNKVIESLVKLLGDVKGSFECLLSPNAKVFLTWSIADFMEDGIKRDLSGQVEIVEKLKLDLGALKADYSENKLQEFLNNLLEISDFFNQFIRTPLSDVVNSATAYNFLGLNSSNSMKDFFDKLYEMYDSIESVIGAYLNKQKIGLITTTQEHERLLQKFIELDLLTEFNQKIDGFAQQKILVNDGCSPEQKAEIFKLLTGYIGRLPLTLEGFKEFFQRCEILNQKIQTAPDFEARCGDNGLDPKLIWDMLAKRVQTKDGLASVSFWRMSDELFNCLIRNKQKFSETGATSLMRIYESLLQCSEAFPKTIEHEHWNLCLEQIEEFIQQDNILKHPMFGLVLKDSISYVLAKGKKYNFEENVKLYTAIGQKNPELMKILQELLAEATPENQTLLYAVLEKTRIIFEKPNNLDGQQVLVRVLADNDLVTHLKEINEILGWLLTHDNFAWAGLLSEDKNWSFNGLRQLYQTFKNTSTPWINAYQEMFPLKPQTWKINPVAQQHEVHVEAEIIQPKKPRNFERWVQKRSSELWGKVRGLIPSEQQPQEDPSAAQAREFEKKAKSFWTIFKNYPYPSVEQVTQWLGEADLTKKEEEIKLFDKGDTQKHVYFPEEDINRWISEVDCYNLKSWSRLESENLKIRLKEVLEKINENMKESRQSLKQEFNQLSVELQQNPQATDLQNKFIAILCTAYYKVVGKVPYPTQILALLLNSRLDNKNLVCEIDTGEGKGVTIGLLALLKFARQENNTVLVRTTTPDLVRQDLYEKKNSHFFNLFDVPSHILDQTMESKDLKPGHIYYSADRDFDVFYDRVLSRQNVDLNIDVILDEIDSYFFDRNTVIKLTEANPELVNFLWIYPQINAYRMLSGDNVQALKQYLLRCNASSPERIEQIQQLKNAQCRQWLMISQRAKNLKENQDFVVRFNKKQDMYEAIPYENGEIKEGFSVGDPLASGLQQFLHAHLNRKDRQFSIAPETRLVSYLEPLNFKNVSSLVGLSGSIGGLPEVWEYQEALNANSARIGRFYPEKITKHPTLVATDEADMLRQIAQLAMNLKQPLLILTDDIEEAQRISDGLNINQLANKKVKILTGIEDDSERRQWLHGKDIDFAKNKNAVTIATKVCSRGIDLTPEVKENVFVLEVGISELRESKQKRGRTGRAGEEGTYQKIVNLKSIERQWRSAFNFDKLPLTKDTLPTYMNKIQSHISANNHQQRMSLRLNDWAKKHVVQYLKEILEKDPQHFQAYFFDYYQHIQIWFMELPKVGMSSEDMIAESIKIWRKVEALLKIRGKGLLAEPENNLEQILKDDQHRIYLLVATDVDRPIERKSSEKSISTASLTESEDNFIPDEVSREAFDAINDRESCEGSETASTAEQDKFNFNLNAKSLVKLRNRLQECEPETSTIKTLFTYIFYFIPDIFQWLNPVATQTQQYLDNAWKTFKEDPSSSNWKDFYRLLLSAKELHRQQSEQSIWHIDYWFDVFNKLRPWVEFSKYIDRELEHLDFSNDSSNSDIFNVIKSKIEEKQIKGLENQPNGLIDRFMQSFQPLFKKDLDTLNENYNAFMGNPSADDLNQQRQADALNQLYQQLQKVQKFHEESQEWRSWRIDYWWYWQSRMEPWMELAHELPKILEEKETEAFKDWKGKQKDISYFQLFYREYLVCKEQLRSRDRRYAFWFWGQENPLSKLNNEYEAKISEKQYSRELRKYELDEVARFFPKEAMINYNLLQQGTKNDEIAEKQQTMYLRVVDIMRKMFNPAQDTPLCLDVSTHRLELFHDELEKWRGRREIMANINQRQ